MADPAELPTPDELTAVARREFKLGIDPDGTGAVNLYPGSRNDAAVSAVAALGTRVVAYTADRLSALRLEDATADDLDNYGRDHFGADAGARKVARVATGVVRLTRPGSTSTLLPRGSRVGTTATDAAPAVVFEIATDTTTVATDLDVAVVAQDTGEAGNLSLGGAAVTQLLDALPDSGWALDTAHMESNPADYVFGDGAADESDAVYRDRLSQITPQATRQRGTKAAVLAGALAVPGVRYVTVIEPRDGTFIVYAGDVNLNLTATLRDAIVAEQDNWRCFGLPPLVRAYNATTVDIAASIYLVGPVSDYDPSALRDAANVALAAYFDGRTRPDEYYVSMIAAAMVNSNRAAIQTVVIDEIDGAAPIDVQRPADAAYGVITALNRYRVTTSSVRIAINGPLTT